MQRSHRVLRGVLIAVVVSVVATMITPAQSGAATSSIGNIKFSQPGKIRLITGDLTTVSGTASSDMVGKTVGLQLKVSGQWTTISQTNVKSNRTFSMSIRAAGPGQVSYRLAAWTGSRWLQVERSFTTWKWYSLVDLPIVDRSYGLSLSPRPGINVAGRAFGTQLAHEFSGYTNGYTDFNLGYKCSVFSSSMGLVDISSSGYSVIFDVAVDGSPVSGVRRSIPLGRLETVSVDVTGGFRLRLINERSSSARAYPAWPNAKVLCSGKP